MNKLCIRFNGIVELKHERARYTNTNAINFLLGFSALDYREIMFKHGALFSGFKQDYFRFKNKENGHRAIEEIEAQIIMQLLVGEI